jgi:hypothetical protein
MKSRTLEPGVKALTMAALLTVCTHALAQGKVVEPIREGAPIKLYSGPSTKDRAPDAAPENMPLQTKGPANNGFYPVVDPKGKSFWVDGMEIKLQRDNTAACNLSAGVHAAGQLGAATNQCK